MIGCGSQASTSCVIRAHVIRSFWLRRRSRPRDAASRPRARPLAEAATRPRKMLGRLPRRREGNRPNCPGWIAPLGPGIGSGSVMADGPSRDQRLGFRL